MVRRLSQKILDFSELCITSKAEISYQDEHSEIKVLKVLRPKDLSVQYVGKLVKKLVLDILNDIKIS